MHSYEALRMWEENHRVLIIAVIAACLWIATYALYFRDDFWKYLRNRRAQRWGVDMATKTVTSGKKPVV